MDKPDPIQQLKDSFNNKEARVERPVRPKKETAPSEEKAVPCRHADDGRSLVFRNGGWSCSYCNSEVEVKQTRTVTNY